MAKLSMGAQNPPDVRPWIRRAVRVGYAAKGVIYLLIGVLALRLALGGNGRLTDSSGVLKTLLAQPFGVMLIAVVGLGILAYAGWEITQAVLDTHRRGSGWRGAMDRALSVIKGVVYGAVGIEAVRLVIGERQAAKGADDYARSAMQFPLGGLALAVVGLGVALYGLRQIWMAWRAEFDDDLDQQHLRREGAGWVLTVGRAGNGARGVILVVIGIALVRAGLDQRASRAAGMSEALWTIFAQPYGQWLLAAVAAGLMCFGLFQVLHARYARV